jgi:DNA-directed RNA polymerase subunit RPC12/RpoP
VPWCEDCNRFWNDKSLQEGGVCPTCGRAILTKASRRIPWHFQLLLVAFAAYMVYRIYWLIEWLPKHV